LQLPPPELPPPDELPEEEPEEDPLLLLDDPLELEPELLPLLEPD